ncbi:MAG: hypothetical protein WCO44_07845 [Bacteroidota bacterium]
MKYKMLLLATVMVAFTSALFAQEDMKETIGMIKKNLADSKGNLKKYEWVETTTFYLKGEKKSVKQSQCYYGVDGKLTKVATGASTQTKTPGGLKGKIVANKKEEMADYVKAAVAKVQTYLPPDAEKIQKVYGAGKLSVNILEPGKKFKLGFPDYNEKGDLLSLSFDKTSQKLMAADVSTYVDDPKQTVIFNVTYSNLPDGTQYPGSTTLDAKAKELKIVIENSGFKKAAGH